LLSLLRLLFASWLCALLLRRRFAPLFYSLLLLLLLLLASLLYSLVLLRLLGLRPSGVIGSLLLHPLILPFLILLDSLPFLILPLIYSLLLPLGLLLPPGIASVHRRTVGARSIVGMNCTWRPVVAMVGAIVGPTPILAPLFIARALIWAIGLLIVLRTLTWAISLFVARALTWAIGLLFVARVLTWAIGLLIVLRTLNVPPIATLVTGSAVGWRIVGASSFSRRYAVFEVSGPCSGCDRRPAVVYGCSLLTIDSR